MKILVTGGAGFIGSHLVDSLVDAGHDIVVVDDLSQGHRQNLNPQAKFYKVDITSERIREIFNYERPELVSHHAGFDLACSDLQMASTNVQVNLIGTLNILEAAAAYEVRKIIYASSAAVYGNTAKYPCTETDHVMPIHAGAINSLTIENYLRLYHQTIGLDFTVLRYPTVYGPRQTVDGSHSIVANLISEMIEVDPVLIEGTGKQELDLIYVSDVVCANLRAITNGGGQIINLGSGQTVSTNQLCEQLKRLIDYPNEVTYIPARPGYIRKTLLDTRKAEATLAWKPQVPLEEGLSLTLSNYTYQSSHGLIA